MYYVYVHKLKHNGEVFYVGKGCRSRKTNKYNRNRFWKNITNKYEWYAEIVQCNLQHWYAIELEANLIAYYGMRLLGQGPLVNLSDGGFGVDGYTRTKETRLKISKGNKGKRTSHIRHSVVNLFTGESFEGTQQDLKAKGIDPALLFKGFMSKGWKLKNEPLKSTRYSRDPRVFIFEKLSTKEQIKATRSEFEKKTGVDVGKLFSKKCKNKTAKGWVVVECVYSPQEGLCLN